MVLCGWGCITMVGTRRAESEDSPAIAALHRQHISWGLLSRLGEGVVTAFYAALIRSPVGFVFVAEQNGRLVGFASGVTRWRRFYWEFLRHYPRSTLAVLAASFRQGLWRHLLKTSRYATTSSLPPAEVVSIALEPGTRGTGLGVELMRSVLGEFAARGVNTIRVTFAKRNVPATILYEQLGFRFHSQVEMHAEQPSVVYVTSLPQALPNRSASSPAAT